FGKEFASQMVPEWREAYMNYNYLKTLLKQILIFHQRQTMSPEIQMNSRPVPPSKAASLRRRVSLFRAFSGLTSRYGNNSPRKDKEDEVILEVVTQAEELSNQMDALIALRIEVIHEDQQPKRTEVSKGYMMASLEVLNHVKINAAPETPLSTIKNVFKALSLDLNFNKSEVKVAEEKLKQAFIEFHQKLRFLKNYAFLNQLAFSKIIKKYDKSTSRNASDAYMKMVEESYLSQSDEVAKLIDRVEAVFIKHFCNGNRHQGMDTLRPKAKREKHRITFFVVCPFDIFYRANRFFFLVCLWHCVCAPLYAVTLPDFILADQFTSQVQLLRNLQFYVCYYGWGDFKKRNAETCNNSDCSHIGFDCYRYISYKCIRRWNDGRDFTQALNGLKYLSTIVALVTRTIYSQKGGIAMKVISASTSGVATIFNTYWDIVMDWGLLSKNSQNPLLRDKLILPSRSIYFIAMVLNVILRLAWMQTVMDFHELPFLHKNALTAIFASLEIIRRGIWNFFRLENEHLNNVGKFRAVKSVPLPFSYEDGYKNL
ncbi:hypothetical protein M8C21_022088, partial [Ambrosia artemisiifolia]